MKDSQTDHGWRVINEMFEETRNWNIKVRVSHLADDDFVTLVVTRQVGENAGSTRDHVDVVRCQQLNQHLQQTLGAFLAMDGRENENYLV